MNKCDYWNSDDTREQDPWSPREADSENAWIDAGRQTIPAGEMHKRIKEEKRAEGGRVYDTDGRLR